MLTFVVTLIAQLNVLMHIYIQLPAVRHSVLDALKQLCVIGLIRAGLVSVKHKVKSVQTLLVDQVLQVVQMRVLESKLNQFYALETPVCPFTQVSQTFIVVSGSGSGSLQQIVFFVKSAPSTQRVL